MHTKTLRQKILDLAIRGKLVPQDPNDEPASVLLERIRAEKERLIAEGKIKRPKKSKASSSESHYQKFEIPNSWVWTTLGEIIELYSGQDFVPGKYNDERNGIPYIIGASNIQDGRIIVSRWTEHPSVISEYGDLLVVCKGAGVGKMGINNVGKCHIARQIQAIRVYGNSVLLDYIQLVLQKGISSIVAQANGLIPGLPRELLLNFPIPLPPIQEQIRISKSFLNFDSTLKCIEQSGSALSTSIKTTKSQILELAMQGKLVPQDPNDEPAADMLRRVNPKARIITDNPHSRNIPRGWCETTVSDLCVFLSRGKSPKYSDRPNQYPVFAQKCNLKDGGISLNQARFLDEGTLNKWPEKYRLKTGDVLINSTGTGTVGRTRYFDECCLGSYPFTVPDSHVSVVRSFDEINSKFLFYYLYSSNTQQYFEDNLAGSTNQKELYIDIIGSTPIILPPVSEQKRIVFKIEELYSVLDKIEASLQS